MSEIILASEVGIDYRHLEDLLTNGEWKKADQETRLLMLQAAKCEKKGFLQKTDWLNFPLTDLRTIDQLWVEYSQGRFGFSVQKRIWKSVVENSEPDQEQDNLIKFSNQVGWRYEGQWLHEKDLKFDLGGVSGHLPCNILTHYTLTQGQLMGCNNIEVWYGCLSGCLCLFTGCIGGGAFGIAGNHFIGGNMFVLGLDVMLGIILATFLTALICTAMFSVFFGDSHETRLTHAIAVFYPVLCTEADLGN